MSKKASNPHAPKSSKKPSPPPAPPVKYVREDGKPVEQPFHATITYLDEIGFGSEEYDFPVETVELDFDELQFAHIKEAARLGGFVSIQEFIRHALREMLKQDKT